MLSHEMRTPLQTIIQFLSILTSLVEQNKQAIPKDYLLKTGRYYDFMRGQLNLTLTFVEDLLDLKQLGEGVFDLRLLPFDPNEVL